MQVEEIPQHAEEALVALDGESLDSLYAPDFVFVETAPGQRITKKVELKSYFKQLFSLPNVSSLAVDFVRSGWEGCGSVELEWNLQRIGK